MKYYIYLITDKTNNKQYIGQTINFEKRMKEHTYGRNKRRNCIIDKAIQKHKKENFEFKIIDSATSQEEIDLLEKKYIKEYNCLKPNGYNILKGGRNQQGAWNMKPILVYDLNGNFIKEYESAGQLERESNYKYSSRDIRRACVTATHKYSDILIKFKDNKENIKKYEKPLSARRRKIKQYDIFGNYICSFNSIIEASKITNTNRTSISGCLSNTYKTANNFIWKYEEDISEIKFDNSIKYKVGTKIYQLDENKKILNEFKSCTQAQDYLKLKKGSYKNIYGSLDKNCKAYGYYWKRV